jgi:hypothetical protein
MFALILVALALSEDVSGCGGFVRLPDAVPQALWQKNFDFTKISLSLNTLSHVTKERTDCVPSGYWWAVFCALLATIIALFFLSSFSFN